MSQARRFEDLKVDHEGKEIRRARRRWRCGRAAPLAKLGRWLDDEPRVASDLDAPPPDLTCGPWLSARS